MDRRSAVNPSSVVSIFKCLEKGPFIDTLIDLSESGLLRPLLTSFPVTFL
jgi:hypothetical protein